MMLMTIIPKMIIGNEKKYTIWDWLNSKESNDNKINLDFITNLAYKHLSNTEDVSIEDNRIYIYQK